MALAEHAATLTVTPVASALGVEIGGIDLSRPLDAGTAAALRQALLDHLVIFFRDQHLTPAQYFAFAQAMGEPMEYPFVKGIDGFPLITPVVKEAHERTNFGGVWHTDTAYLPEPPKATMLLALEVPPIGGDTMFASQQMAYDSLSDGLRATLGTLTGVNSSVNAAGIRTRVDRDVPAIGNSGEHGYVAEHPVVRTHPESGRKALYVNRGHTVAFRDWSPEESQPLLNYLFAHQVKEEFTCRFRWRPGSLALWDNRAVLHYPLNDYHGHRREMLRITLQGDKPF